MLPCEHRLVASRLRPILPSLRPPTTECRLAVTSRHPPRPLFRLIGRLLRLILSQCRKNLSRFRLILSHFRTLAEPFPGRKMANQTENGLRPDGNRSKSDSIGRQSDATGGQTDGNGIASDGIRWQTDGKTMSADGNLRQSDGNGLFEGFQPVLAAGSGLRACGGRGDHCRQASAVNVPALAAGSTAPPAQGLG